MTFQDDAGEFTMVSHTLAKESGLVCAAVYGVVWRYCQMKEGLCRASLNTLGNEINLDRATVLRSIEKLCKLGYLIDQTPDRRNAPHTYILGRSVALCNTSTNETVVVNNTNGNETVAYNNSYIKSVAQNNATVAESYLNRVLEENKERELHAPELSPKEELGKELNDICGYDPETLRNGTKQRLTYALDVLWRKKATPPLVRRFKNDYWWGTGPPTADQVIEEWNRFQEWLKKPAVRPEKKVSISAK